MSNNSSDGRRSTTMEELMGLFAIKCRKQTVHSLLAGNDSQCFTTEQYLAA